MTTMQQHDETPMVSPDEAKTALQRVLASEEFRGSNRMQTFLSYVVREAASGRADTIRAKTIAMDVYGYDVDDLSKREGVVRVDAGRLRKRLEAYATGSGSSDPVIISMPMGSYAPQFQRRTHEKTAPDNMRPKGRSVALAFMATALIGAAGAGLFVWRDAPLKVSGADQPVLYDVAPARVEAINLCNAGRELIFPVVNLARLRPALQIFETAIERDPNYYCGHAGAAQVETILTLLQPQQPDAQTLLQRADTNSARAIELAPEASWALSARAWLEFAAGNYEAALSLSTRAVKMRPKDPHIAEFDALILLYTSNFDRILEQSGHYAKLAQSGGGLVFDNALGSAYFHTGNYTAAIETFESTIARGGPFGPISAAYLIAAHWKNGEKTEARRLARVYEQTWPDFPLQAIKSRAFSTDDPVKDLMGAIKAAGMSN